MKKKFCQGFKQGHFYLLCLVVVSAILVCPQTSFAQNGATGTIKGTVTDKEAPLSGASVKISGTNIGTVADANGNYSLNVKAGTYNIEATYVGYGKVDIHNITVTPGSIHTLNITLQSSNQLEEVQVSYGRQRQREVTGSIAQISAGPLQDMPVMQFAQQLQGKIAGVSIAQSSGQPGRGMAFRIRGAASLSTGYQPLFVIDGLPITGSINNINPDEIESFTVLKDASASALYGSRAANGVILITTKHAKAGDSKIEFSSNYGVQKIPMAKVPKVMNGTQWAEFMKERFEDMVKYENFTGTVPAEYQGDPSRFGEGTNWFKLMTRTAPIQSYSLTLQSAGEKSSSTVIAGYEEQQGVVVNTGTKLYTLRINHDMSIGSKRQLKAGFNVAPSYRLDHNNRISSDAVGGYYERLFEASPIISPYQPDGSYTQLVSSPGMVSYINPLAIVKESIDDYITTRILANAYLNYQFLPALSLRTNVGVDKGAETQKTFLPFVVLNNPATGTSGSVDNYSYTAEANLHYEKRFFSDHHVEVLAGYSVQKFNSISNTLSGTGFPSSDIPYLSAATSITAGRSNTTQYSMLSTIGRLNYDYKGKYLLQGSIRRDGSSRFGEDRKFGNFPSISAGWIISNEKFMDKFKNLDLLKIRGSYGVTGNNDFGNYTAIPVLGNFNYILNGTLVSGQTISTLGNTELAWERNKQLDVAVDIAILHNRVSFTYDYYHKVSDGLIQDRPIPRGSGFTTIKYNIGNFEFWGHEFTLNTVNLDGKVKWNTNLNLSFERNLIKSLVSPGFIRRNNTVSSDYYRNQEGHHLGEFYGFVYLGLYKDSADLANSAKYQSTGLTNNGVSDIGTIKVQDLNGDGKIDDVNDRTFIGDPTPDFTFGFTNTFNYKNIDLNISMAGSVGGQILAASKWAYLTNMDGSRLPIATALDHWRSIDNPGSGIYPRTKTGTTAMGRQVNSQWIENGSYLTAKNISLGYSFKLNNKMLLKSFRLYASIQQAFIITGYSGANPEISLTGLDATSGVGVDENAYPVPRTFSVGFTTTFK